MAGWIRAKPPAPIFLLVESDNQWNSYNRGIVCSCKSLGVVQGLIFSILFHLEVKTYWNTTSSPPFLLKSLQRGQQGGIFQCPNCLAKEIQSNTFFLVYFFAFFTKQYFFLLHVFPFHFLFLQWPSPGLIWHSLRKIKKKDLQNITTILTTTSP